MKGKLLNIRGETISKITENKEINEIKQILGLEIGLVYTQQLVYEKLRYGKILFMTDQDLDGSHIKGLGINLFDAQWPSLISIPNFIGFMNTPLLKARKKDKELLFYNEGEFNLWKNENNHENWKIKYYKGLGTSTAKEFKEYFKNKKEVMFNKLEKEEELIDMIFNKKRSNDRKDWLYLYDRTKFLNTNKTNVSYREFIDNEFIHFSKADCDRSIPALMDGLKISQRKILFSAFKRNLKDEIKVAQLSGYVSEHSGYHHGEASLNGAIINMAQTYVGSNNINILSPQGQFGTRIQGGKDAASERYIFTYLNKLIREIYKQEDDNILNYLEDDGLKVEPLYYAPIIPMILVNGSKGIGTGFSTDILSYNPEEIILNIEKKIKKEELNKINPYYEGFKGIIEEISNNKYLIKGIYKINKNSVFISELPLGTWNQDYIEYLASLLNNKKTDKKKIVNNIADFKDLSSDTNVDIEVVFYPNKISNLLEEKLDYNINGLEKLLKLYTTKTINNMHLFDYNDKLKKYNNVQEIVDDYYIKRYELYKVRKSYQLKELNKELIVLSNKAKYIQENLDNLIDLRKMDNDAITKLLENRGYDKLTIGGGASYNYLTKLPMDSVSKQNSEKILNEKLEKEKLINILKNKTIEEIWLEELDNLKTNYKIYKNIRYNLQNIDKEPLKTKIKLKNSK